MRPGLRVALDDRVVRQVAPAGVDEELGRSRVALGSGDRKDVGPPTTSALCVEPTATNFAPPRFAKGLRACSRDCGKQDCRCRRRGLRSSLVPA